MNEWIIKRVGFNEEFLREASILRKAIDPDWLRMIREKRAYLAGGAVRSVFTSMPIVDFDIFLDWDGPCEGPKEFFGKEDDSPTCTVTDTAFSLKKDGGNVYQVVTAEIGSPERVMSLFDFTCCQAAWIPGDTALDDVFIFHESFLKDCAARRLVFNMDCKFPICSMWRSLKYIKRGFRLSATEAIKMGLKIAALDIGDRAELKRQLMGIDTLFLKPFTDAMDDDPQKAFELDDVIKMLAEKIREIQLKEGDFDECE